MALNSLVIVTAWDRVELLCPIVQGVPKPQRANRIRVTLHRLVFDVILNARIFNIPSRPSRSMKAALRQRIVDHHFGTGIVHKDDRIANSNRRTTDSRRAHFAGLTTDVGAHIRTSSR